MIKNCSTCRHYARRNIMPISHQTNPECNGCSQHHINWEPKEKTMIECTLQEAIKRCKENGGRARPSSWNVIWYTAEELLGDATKISIKNALENWIYEPQKESAFQKWNGSWTECHCVECGARRKEGWNAAIDEVLKVKPSVMVKKEGLVEIAQEFMRKQAEAIKGLKEP